MTSCEIKTSTEYGFVHMNSKTSPDNFKNSDLKILHIAPLPPPYGGMVTYFQQFRESKIWAKCNHYVIRADYLSKYRFAGTKRFFVNCINLLVLLVMVVYRTMLFRPSILHIQTNSGAGFFEKAMLVVLGRFVGRKVLLHVHGGGFRQRYIDYPAWLKRIVRDLLKASHCIIVASPQMRDTFLMIGVKPEKIALLPNAINLPDPAKCSAKEESTSGKTQITVLFLNRIYAAKGIREFVAVALDICASYPQASFRIAGDCTGKEVGELRESIAERGLSERIKFLGKIDEEEKCRELCSADIYVLPSYVEDLPYGLIEAMAYGIACVASEVGGIPSLIEDGKSGLLCKPQDVSSLKTSVERLIQDNKLRQKLAENARQTIADRFNWERRADEFENLYRKVLKS
jgi:glycosyltransferase involved in cell wall biosynthesis